MQRWWLARRVLWGDILALSSGHSQQSQSTQWGTVHTLPRQLFPRRCLCDPPLIAAYNSCRTPRAWAQLFFITTFKKPFRATATSSGVL